MGDACPASIAVREPFGVASITPVALKAPTVWRFGDHVLKRLDADDPAEAEWLGRTLTELVADVLVPDPIVSDAGTYFIDGWVAHRFVPTRPVEASTEDVLAAGRRLHHGLVGVQCPTFLATRRSDYTRADRIAWEEETWQPEGTSLEPIIEALLSSRRPIASTAQIVHGDLAGNVEISADGALVVLDMSPYWRPTEWALAVAAIDRRQWHGEGPRVFEDFDLQMLIRAALFRTVVATLLRPVGPDEVRLWERTLDELGLPRT